MGANNLIDGGHEAPSWRQVSDVLFEEANVLAADIDGGKVDSLLKDAGLSPRVKISVLREIRRLRYLASWVEKNCSQEEEER